MYSLTAHSWISKRSAAALVFLVIACEGDDRTRITMPSGSKTAGLDMGESPGDLNVGTSPADPLPASCLRAGTDAAEREQTLADIAYSYIMSQGADCRTTLLTMELSNDQTIDWYNYIFNYTSALFGCGLAFSPLPGGIDAFGPGNTDAVGVPSPVLGPDDAAILIELYVASIASALAVSGDQLTDVRTHLERAAAARIDPTLGARLAKCPAP